MSWKLLVGTVVVLAFVCGGESNLVNGLIGLSMVELTDRVSFHSDSRVTRVCSDVEENMMLPK